MKKVFSLLMSLLLILLVTGCGNDAAPVSQPSVSDAEKISADKALVVYFSMPETNNPIHMTIEEKNSLVVVDGKIFGNTHYVAQIIQKHTDADIFRIEPETPYPMNHADLEQVATKEKRTNARPAIAEKIQNFDDYKIFFVGYPNWYGDMPKIMYTFFEEYDFTGKTIVPFVTSGGAGFSNSINEIKYMQPNAKVIENGLSLNRDIIPTAEPDIEKWLKTLGF